MHVDTLKKQYVKWNDDMSDGNVSRMAVRQVWIGKPYIIHEAD